MYNVKIIKKKAKKLQQNLKEKNNKHKNINF